MKAKQINEGMTFEIDDLVYCESPLTEADCTSAEPLPVSDKLLHALHSEAYKGGAGALRKKIQTTPSWSRLAGSDYGYQPRRPPEADDLIAEFLRQQPSAGGFAARVAMGMRRKRLMLLVVLFGKVNHRLPSQAELAEPDQVR